MIETIPHHGVHGTHRSEPWLSLVDDQQQTRRLIVRLAYEIYSSVFVGNPAPIVSERFNRMKDVRPGDLVVETSGVLYSTARAGKGILTDEVKGPFGSGPVLDNVTHGVGYLIKKSREWVPDDDEDLKYAEPDDDKGYFEDYWYVQYGPSPDDVTRWHNCEFIAIDLGWQRDLGGFA